MLIVMMLSLLTIGGMNTTFFFLIIQDKILLGTKLESMMDFISEIYSFGTQDFSMC